MRTASTTRKLALAACTVAALAIPSAAQGAGGTAKQVVNPAPVNYWMDISTGQPMQGSGLMGLGAMMGGGDSGFGSAFGNGDNWFGAANMGQDGKRVDIAIFDTRKPGEVKADQAIPKSAKLGASLPLRPPAKVSGRTPFDEPTPEAPEGKMKITIKTYWGCGAKVRPGQPNVQTIEFDSKKGVDVWGEALRSRVEIDRGATSNRNSSFWPNKDNSKRVPKDASLAGTHTVTGAGLPASLSFSISATQDFLPELGLSSSGDKASVITLAWSPLAQASAYFVNASGMAMAEGSGGKPDEMTFTQWSSSEVPEAGDGLVNYLSNANQEKYLKEKAILPISKTSCEIPAGIFADAMFVNARGIAYGRELNIVHPERPSDPKVAWNQEWTARVRVKSVANLMVGNLSDMMAAGMAAEGMADSASDLPKCPPPEAGDIVKEALMSQIPGAGLFGKKKKDQPTCQP